MLARDERHSASPVNNSLSGGARWVGDERTGLSSSTTGPFRLEAARTASVVRGTTWTAAGSATWTEQAKRRARPSCTARHWLGPHEPDAETTPAVLLAELQALGWH